jgi:SpoVK/Ycf46/Vps4 family AAA+-type ATPase
VRYLRDIAAKFEASRHTLVLLSPELKIPSELDKTIVLLDWPLPDEAELTAILKKCEQDLPTRIPVTLNGNREKVVQSLRGLTAFEAGSVLMNAIAATGELGQDVIEYIVAEKSQIIRKSGTLEFYDTDTTMSSVGGLKYLKSYAAIQRNAFSQEAADFGVDTPKGLPLVGVPGTGKSLAAKAIAGGQMPLLLLDIGGLMNSGVGGSEANMRTALKVAEAISPCVLWVDEIEKATTDNNGASDGGVMARMIGTLLTWMQEKTAPVYIVATANDVANMRAELLRAGRFDKTFWVDLPSHADRVEIVTVHLGKRNKKADDYDLDTVADSLWGFTGAEIEQVVKDAVRVAFFEKTTLTTTHLLDAAKQVVPIAQTMSEKIQELRNWASGRAQWAGDPIEPRPTQKASASRTDDL